MNLKASDPTHLQDLVQNQTYYQPRSQDRPWERGNEVDLLPVKYLKIVVEYIAGLLIPT